MTLSTKPNLHYQNDHPFDSRLPPDPTTHSVHHIRRIPSNTKPKRFTAASGSESISFRDAPVASFDSLLKCISHYRGKAKGKYGEKVAARYLFDMAKDLEAQIGELKQREGSQLKRLYKEIQWLRKVVKEWELCFGMEFVDSCATSNKENQNPTPKEVPSCSCHNGSSQCCSTCKSSSSSTIPLSDRLTPQQVKRRLEFQEKEMNKYKQQLEEMRLENERMRHVHQKAVEEAHESARNTLHSQISQINAKVEEMHKQNEAAFQDTLQSKNELIHVLEKELSELKGTVDPLRESLEEYKTYGKHVHRQLKVMRDAIASSKEMNQALYDELLNYQNEMHNEDKRGTADAQLTSSSSTQMPLNNATQILNHTHVHDLKKEILKQQLFIKQMKETHKEELSEKDAQIRALEEMQCHCDAKLREYQIIIQQLEAARHMKQFYDIKKRLPDLLKAVQGMEQTIPNHSFMEGKQPDHLIRREQQGWKERLQQQKTESDRLLQQVKSKR